MSTAFVVAPWTQPSTIYQKLITPPAVEPLTVEEAKLLAAMTWPVTDPPDLRDAMVADFIRAARERVERDTGLALISQVRELHVRVPLNVIPLPSQCLPATEILNITPVINPLDAPPPDSGVEWIDTFFGLIPLIVPYTYPAGTVIQVTAGWPDPETLKAEAPLLHHAVGLLTSHYLTLGRDLAITGAVASVNSVPETYEESIQPYRLVYVA